MAAAAIAKSGLISQFMVSVFLSLSTRPSFSKREAKPAIPLAGKTSPALAMVNQPNLPKMVTKCALAALDFHSANVFSPDEVAANVVSLSQLSDAVQYRTK